MVIEQIKAAYRAMSQRAHYRPAAPSDGMGNITVPAEQLNLEKEAEAYAKRWWADEDKFSFFIGCGDGQTRKALIFTVEAARNLCLGRSGDHVALKLLKMAVEEMERTVKDRENQLTYQFLGINVQQTHWFEDKSTSGRAA